MTDCDGEKRVGQNTARKMHFAYLWPTYPEYSITEFVNGWALDGYTYGEEPSNHYTQVVWAKTAEVGCGLKTCETTDTGLRKVVAFVCTYNPGNYVREMPYTQGPPCSACSSVIKTGGWLCENNLCVPCTPEEDEEKCTCEEKVCQNGGVFNPGTCVCECPAGVSFGDLCENKCECVD